MLRNKTLKITTPSDRELSWTREFNASRKLVFDAMTKPELIRRWLLGPEGWTMPVCEVDLRVGLVCLRSHRHCSSCGKRW